MRETQTVVIDGTTYTVTQVGAKAARRIELRCARLLVAGLQLDDLRKGDTGAIETLLAAVADGLTDADLDLMFDVFAAETKISLALQTTTGVVASAPTPLAATFDDHFAGANHANMWRWFAFCLRFNFASFLGELGTLLPGLVVKGSAPQKEPMPQSGASSSLNTSANVSAR